MGYNMLKNVPDERFYKENGLAKNALLFIRNSCENLRYNIDKSVHLDDDNLDCDGTSIKPNQIPYNMQMDIDSHAYTGKYHGILICVYRHYLCGYSNHIFV